jgi:glutamine cyclotransferase
MKNTPFILVSLALLLASGCGRSQPPAGTTDAIVHYSYEVVQAWPHDTAAFTEGLLFRNGDLLESTGLNGESTLRDVDIKTGRVLKKISIPAHYFGEGLTVIGSRAYQLTWKNGIGFIYDADTFQWEGRFAYTGEGWGLTTDGHWLVLSDGTSRIRFLDPGPGPCTDREVIGDLHVVRSIDVTEAGQPVERLNGLAWIKGEIFCNVWQTDKIVRIDPATGIVRGVIDLAGLLPPEDHSPDTDVLNGIAYDDAHDRIFVTGKRWPKVFEIRLKPKP